MEEENDSDIRSRIQKILGEYADPSLNQDYIHENEMEEKWRIRDHDKKAVPI